MIDIINFLGLLFVIFLWSFYGFHYREFNIVKPWQLIVWLGVLFTLIGLHMLLGFSIEAKNSKYPKEISIEQINRSN